ncbi:Cucumber peeling cupredoxin-like protein [Quillaja saponaria]|uniref:Cucumber peeling cupredoxin-like protein n=1 Tax=Quillaja saponaria TaxID=32244 RepID=A0AAD7LFD0_QUISA|nr:Cucumber peeling cupredoxin-like protein [Quillaja saponaria]
MAGRIIELAILAISVSAILRNTAAQKKHVVGDELGWFLPPRGPIAYDTWASLQTFSVGDILAFNFINEEQDVAQVTNEAYKTCNSTNPISLKATSPANFSLHSPGDYYFISSFDRHCLLGQKLAISVPASSPQPSPAVSPRGPITYTVGDELGWLVPPAAEIAYHTWAFGNAFIVGDTLVFQYINGAQDVAEVNKEAHENCETKKAILLFMQVVQPASSLISQASISTLAPIRFTVPWIKS